MFDLDLSVFYVISQIFAFLSIVFDMISIQQKKKARLLNMVTVAAFTSFLHYVFLGAWPGIVNKTITTVRNAIAAHEASHKKKSANYLPIIFIICYIIFGIVTFDSLFSLLPMAASSTYSFVIYKCDVKKVRYTSIITNTLWLVYNICVFTIVGILAEILIIANGLIAVYKYRKKK